MPRTKNYLSYPESFQDLIRAAVANEIRVPCGTALEAMKLRGRLYGYFGALRKAGQEKDAPEEVRELRQMAYKVQLVLDGTELVARPLDQDPMGHLVAGALKAQDPARRTAMESFKPSQELLDAIQREMKKPE